MTSVPSTVPSTPCSVILSNRQIIKNEAATNKPRNNHGLHGPALSMVDVNEFNDGSKTRRHGIAKKSFESASNYRRKP